MFFSPVLALTLLGCTPDVTHLYAGERETALAVATDVPAGWKPDAAVAIASRDLAVALSAVVTTAVSADRPAITLPLPLGIQASLKPDLKVKRAKISSTTDCAACFSLDIALEGDARWEAGPASGTVPISAAATAIIAVSVRDGSIVEVKPRRIGSLAVEVPSLGNLRVNASGPLQEWLRATLLNKVPAIRVATLAVSALPVRDLRLTTSADRLQIEILTNVPGGVALRALPAPSSGVEVALSESVLSGLARRAAFKAGTLDLDVAVDPRKIEVEGEQFTMDLRLWRLVGRGWYRDYSVTGSLGVTRGTRPRLTLSATDARETGASPGAIFVDPIAALFQSKILDAIVDAMDRSLPAQAEQRVAGVGMQAKATEARGLDDALHLYGSLEVVQPESR